MWVKFVGDFKTDDTMPNFKMAQLIVGTVKPPPNFQFTKVDDTTVAEKFMGKARYYWRKVADRAVV